METGYLPRVNDKLRPAESGKLRLPRMNQCIPNAA